MQRDLALVLKLVLKFQSDLHGKGRGNTILTKQNKSIVQKE